MPFYDFMDEYGKDMGDYVKDEKKVAQDVKGKVKRIPAQVRGHIEGKRPGRYLNGRHDEKNSVYDACKGVVGKI